MKTATHGLLRVDRDLTVQPQTRLQEMKTENCILTFHSGFIHRLCTVWPTHRKPVHCLLVYHLACEHVVRSFHVASIKDLLGYLKDQL